MIYKTTTPEIQKLLSLPETGMGYQIIESGHFTKSRYVVYNAQIAINIDQYFNTFKKRLFNEGFKITLQKIEPIALTNITLLRKTELMFSTPIFETKFMADKEKKDKKRQNGGKGAIDNPIQQANGLDMFVRVSAYEDDKRIDFVNKRLTDGTYTTTLQDYTDCVQTQDDPVDRYALPNDEEIKWAFYIQPKKADELQLGIVQPAFEHAGGGIEAYFHKGTSYNTYLSKKPYGS